MASTEELRIILRTIAETNGAAQVSRSLGQVKEKADAAKRSTALFGSEGSTEIIRFAASLVGLNLGLSLATGTAARLRDVIAESVNVTREHERVIRATTASYGQNAASFQRFAASLEEQTGFTSDAILEASLSARTLSTNYGLTIEQTQKLITVSADLARVRGIGVAEAFERVQSAIRGEAEASEFLGLTLNATFLQQHAANGAFKDTFTTLTDTQRAQVVYNELLKQTAAFSGLAATSTNNLDASFDRAAVSGRKVQLTIGEMVKPSTLSGLKLMADTFGVINSELKIASQLPAGALLTAFIAGGPGAVAGLVTSGLPAQREQEIKATQAAAQAERDLKRIRDLNANTPPVADRATVIRREQAERNRVDQQNRRLQEINELPTRDNPAETRRLAFLDQLEAATRDVVLAQQAQTDLQRQAVSLSAQEAEIRLQQLPAERALAELQRQSSERQIAARTAALPATEALEDLQFAQRRAQLVASNLNSTPDDRRAAFRQLFELGRGQNDVEIGALDTSRGVTEAGRVGTRVDLAVQLQQIANQRALDAVTTAQQANQLLLSINAAVEQTAQQRLDDTLAQAIKDGIASVKDLPVNVHFTIQMPDGTTQVIDQLIEANGQANTPPVIQVSGVRR